MNSNGYSCQEGNISKIPYMYELKLVQYQLRVKVNKQLNVKKD